MGRLSGVKWCLLGCLIGVLALVGASALLPGRVTNAVELIAGNEFVSRVRALTERETMGEDTTVEMGIETVGVSKIDSQPIVILKEKAGERYLIIWIGLCEANDISVSIKGVHSPRPLSPDLTCSIVDRLGARVDSIIINDIQENIYYATIVLTANDWMKREIDSRPSDAMAIAVRVGAPIYAEEIVLEKAGIKPEPGMEEYILAPIAR
jgi:hypothetical protein